MASHAWIPCGFTTTHPEPHTHHAPEATTIADVLEHLIDNGLDGMAHAIEIVLNESMKLERSQFLGAGSYERTEDRRGYSNGFKAKRVKTRVGKLDLRVPKTRQWVLSMPWRLRYLLASDPALCSAVRRSYLRAIFAFYSSRLESEGFPDGRTGAVNVVQRFGSALNLNVHFHALVLDGVYTAASPFAPALAVLHAP